MHIPDGFLSSEVTLATWIFSGASLKIILKDFHQKKASSELTVMGLNGAFIFVAQMLNFPILTGTSGHLLGGTLLAILHGPSAACLIMTAVLCLQALLFGDGGIWALGANILNMAIVGVGVGALSFHLLSFAFNNTFKSIKHFNPVLSFAFLSAILSVVASAALCSAELALSGTSPWSLTSLLMLRTHFFIGCVEAGITALLLSALIKMKFLDTNNLLTTSSTLLETTHPTNLTSIKWFRIALPVILSMAFFLTPFASENPDGLEVSAKILNFSHLAKTPSFPIMAEHFISYMTHFFNHTKFFSTSVSQKLSLTFIELLGGLILFVVFYVIGRIRKSSKVVS